MGNRWATDKQSRGSTVDIDNDLSIAGYNPTEEQIKDGYSEYIDGISISKANIDAMSFDEYKKKANNKVDEMFATQMKYDTTSLVRLWICYMRLILTLCFAQLQ